MDPMGLADRTRARRLEVKRLTDSALHDLNGLHPKSTGLTRGDEPEKPFKEPCQRSVATCLLRSVNNCSSFPGRASHASLSFDGVTFRYQSSPAFRPLSHFLLLQPSFVDQGRG